MEFRIGAIPLSAAVVLSLISRTNLMAATLHEQPHGPPLPPPAIGIEVGGGQTVGVRFSLDQPAHITALNTIIGDSPNSFYAALVPLDSMTGLPAGSPLLDGEVIHSEVFNTSWDMVQTTIPFDVTVGAGAYALLLGSDLFGARAYVSGTAAVYQSIQGNDGLDYTADAIAPWMGWHETPGMTIGVTIEGTVIPEPWPIRFVVFGPLVLCGHRRKWFANLLTFDRGLGRKRGLR
jgi:hypothetical protein